MRLRSAVRHVLGESEGPTAPLPGHAIPRLCDRGPRVVAEAGLPPGTLLAASPPQRRGAYRVSVALRATVEWRDPENSIASEAAQGVVVNLSGSGAQLCLRQRPPLDSVLLSIDPPEAFVEDRAISQLSRPGGAALFPTLGSSGFRQVGESVRTSLQSVEARVVYAKAQAVDSTGPIFALSLAFLNPHDGCYRLVRFLERLSLKADGGNNPVSVEMAQSRV